ncbi:MAG TPA: DASS family sodium-coupled anion symporter [Flavisolibacter sp.]|nr:DASS family sodium-coupled anion symporter [Flavisolibacter sp.]
MTLTLSKQLQALICAVIAIAFFLINPFGVKPEAAKVIALAMLMITLWVTEALPMPVTALLPLIFFPLLGVSSMDNTVASYANPVIYLFLGGFLIALAIEKCNLHQRIALNIVKFAGTSGNRIILGFIIATGLISTWLSNTATTMMMLPIAVSVIDVMKKGTGETNNEKGMANFSLCLMLSIALASNLAIGTIIGTPPNVAYAAYIKKHLGQEVSFVKWMYLCMPLSILLMFILYWVMVKWLYPNNIKKNKATDDLIHEKVNRLGKISVAEKRVLIIFICTATLWITKDLINQLNWIKLDDTIIALLGGLSFFFLRTGGKKDEPLLLWEDTRKLAWGILLLFGGGIALADALEKAGLIQQVGTWLLPLAYSQLVLIFLVTFVSLFLSEVMSNVAQVIVFAPVVTGLAEAAGMHPFMLGIPMTLAASCASMLPMGTPPNAIAFSSGYIRLKDMTRVGFVMNIISVILITLFCWLLLPLVIKM